MSNTSRLLVALATLLAACGVNNPASFRDAFPDPSVLVTTVDPEGVRAQLAEADLPDDSEHKAALLALLGADESIDAAHLVLLARAVALPADISVHNNRGRWTYPQRGEADNAAFVDQLLTEGAEKIRDIDAYWLGELIGISQSDATMLMLCNRFVPQADDGSDRAFQEVLRGMPGSPAMLPFLQQYMIPQGRFDGKRRWLAFDGMLFDDNRVLMLGVVVQHEPEITKEQLLKTMEAFSFDGGRERAFGLLVEQAKPIDVDTAHAAIAMFSFDDGRDAAFATLAKAGSMEINERDLLKFVKLFSFDSGRFKPVKLFADLLQGEATFENAKKLLGEFSFDQGRLKVVEVMAPRWRSLPVKERMRLADEFSFDSNGKKALGFLMR
jgi:hypothetical protein